MCYFCVFYRDWDGVNYYEQQRATLIAEDLQFVAFAADIYGADLHNVSNMTLRRELADLYRSNATLFTNRIQAAINVVKDLENVDAERIALIGYCFGGTGVLIYAMTLGKTSGDEVAAVVSFHGGLTSILGENSTMNDESIALTNVTTKVLVLSGGADDAASEIMDLESTMNARGANWEITRYSGIEHAFTVFDDERYNQYVRVLCVYEYIVRLVLYSDCIRKSVVTYTLVHHSSSCFVSGRLAIVG
jgi:dienelactone hydrolase